MKWSIYNRLLESMERMDLVIRDFVVGTEWCMVLAEDGTGELLVTDGQGRTLGAIREENGVGRFQSF